MFNYLTIILVCFFVYMSVMCYVVITNPYKKDYKYNLYKCKYNNKL